MANINEDGRSMIEMLGVLAIISVLSVGGIAGYTKAMDRYTMNRTIQDYTYLINGLAMHFESMISMPKESNLFPVAEALNLIPDNWSRYGERWYTDVSGG